MFGEVNEFLLNFEILVWLSNMELVKPLRHF
jgi:hypothetical protein